MRNTYYSKRTTNSSIFLFQNLKKKPACSFIEKNINIYRLERKFPKRTVPKGGHP